jgi:hypothetical protein
MMTPPTFDRKMVWLKTAIVAYAIKDPHSPARGFETTACEMAVPVADPLGSPRWLEDTSAGLLSPVALA